MSQPASEAQGIAIGDADLATAPETLLHMSRLSRSFGETQALSDASLTVRRGEIHSIAGENGSGKSTLMKILGGVVKPDAGDITWQGKTVRFSTPRAAQEAGISMVFQETLVVPEFTVRDNIFLGTDGMFRHHRHREAETREAAAALANLGLDDLDVETPLWQLSLAERQLITIARAIVRPWRLLILDESTSALDLGQRNQLFEYLRSAKVEGKSVLFTSHRMDEVQQLADTVSILRLGKSVARLAMSTTSAAQILQLMAGRTTVERVRAAEEAKPLQATRQVADAPSVLRVQEVCLRRNSRPMSLALSKGEILGVAGLEGQGQVEFADCIAALTKPAAGRIEILGKDGSWGTAKSFADANRRGIAFVPRDRRHEGLFGPLSILDNFGFGVYPELSTWGWLRRRAIMARFLQYAEHTRLVYGSMSDTIGTLSGGNQQKVLLGRWLATHPRILVLNDPMRGVDANTKEELYNLLRSLAEEGLSVVLVSTEILELLTLADRIAVFHEGNLQALIPIAGTTDTEVMAAMFGHPLELGNDE